MNLGEIVDVAQAKYMSATHGIKGVNFNRAFAVTSVNLGYHRIERGALWAFSEAEVDNATSTANQTAMGNLPTDIATISTVFDLESEAELVYHDDRQGVLSPSATGVPSHYSEWAGTLKLWPKPTASAVRDYLVRYYRRWPDLVDDTDEPVLPAAWHEVLASYAARTLVLRTPPEGNRFLPASAAEPFEIEWREGLMSLLDSPLTLKSIDKVPFRDHELLLHEGQGQLW